MRIPIEKLITYIMLFIGFPLIIYIIISFANQSFNMFIWNRENNPSFALLGLIWLISTGIGIILLNDKKYNNY